MAAKYARSIGLGTADKPHPVQAAFIAEEAAQCGYCTNGWIMTAVAVLERNANPTDAEIRTMLAGLKCRCGTHMSIMRARAPRGRRARLAASSGRRERARRMSADPRPVPALDRRAFF